MLCESRPNFKGAAKGHIKMLEIYTNSEVGRFEILKAMLDNDMQKATNLLRIAIEGSYRGQRTRELKNPP